MKANDCFIKAFSWIQWLYSWEDLYGFLKHVSLKFNKMKILRRIQRKDNSVELVAQSKDGEKMHNESKSIMDNTINLVCEEIWLNE